MTKKQLIGPTASLLFSIAGMALVKPAFAQPTEIQNRALSGRLQTYTGVNFVDVIIPNLITILFIAAVVVAVVVFIYGAIRFITSAGNKEDTVKGRETMVAAMVGLIVLFILYAIIRLIEYFFDINLLVLDIGPLLLR